MSVSGSIQVNVVFDNGIEKLFIKDFSDVSQDDIENVIESMRKLIIGCYSGDYSHGHLKIGESHINIMKTSSTSIDIKYHS